MKKHTLPVALLTALFLVLFSACGGSEYEAAMSDDDTESTANHGQGGIVDNTSQKNIVKVAAGSPDHTTLVAAVQAADLVGVLSNTGPLTVFAPTNAAFDKLPDGTLDDLLKPENKAKLAKIITSHAAAGKYLVEYLKDGMNLAQATGHKVPVEVREDGTYVNGTKIIATINASNGIIHVVDDVFLIVDDLVEYLKDGMNLAQATGHKVPVEVREDGTYVNGTKIIATINASNGIIHVVDDVFLIVDE